MQTLRAGCSIKADPQTHKHTDSGNYNTLCSLARSVIEQPVASYRNSFIREREG